MEHDIAIIICPPVKDFPEPPKDMSKCTKESCTKCYQLMWASEKKKSVYCFAINAKKETLFCCYDCFIRITKEKSGEWEEIGLYDIKNMF